MTQTFTIYGKLPGMNEYTDAQRTNRYGGASMKRDSQKAVEAYIRDAKLKPMKSPIRIIYAYYEPNRRRDKDNISGFAHKVVQDALVACGIIRNDGWDNIVGFADVFFVDKNRPRIVVMCEEKE